MYLTQFKKNPDGVTYHLKFEDGLESDLSVQELRDNCPCANCRGEEVLLHKYVPSNQNEIIPQGYQLENAKPVGNYALQLYWGDGHSTGIYTWEMLRKLSKITA